MKKKMMSLLLVLIVISTASVCFADWNTPEITPLPTNPPVVKTPVPEIDMTWKNFSESRFSFRNDIMFGMVLEDVEEIEINKGSTIIKKSYDGGNSSLIVGTSVAGFDNTQINYSFDYASGLYEIVYSWNDFDGHLNTDDPTEAEKYYSECKKKYDTIEKILSDKYETIGKIDNNGATYLPYGKTRQCHFLKDLTDRKYDVHGFKQYLVKDDDNYVVILITSFSSQEITLAGLVCNVYCFVDYSRLSKSQLDEIIQTVEDNKEKIYNDF